METLIGIDPPTLETARRHVLAWGMGYVPGDTERGAYGWTQYSSSGMHFKHHKIILIGGQMEAHGLAVIEVDRARGSIERWWGLAIPHEQWRIPPDEICEQMGLTSPMEADIEEVEVEDLDACQRCYVDWIQAFWSNTTHRALVQRLAEAMLSRETWAGADIATFLDEAAQALGPGAVEAPV
jgi:hypothetical protein